MIAYESLVGSAPLQADKTPAMLYMQVHEPLPPMWEKRPGVPAAVEAVLERVLARAPEERYSSGAALVEALGRSLRWWGGGERRGPGAMS